LDVYPAALDADGVGGVLLVGGAVAQSGQQVATVFTRFSAEGTLDRSFGRDGYALVSLPSAFYNGHSLRRVARGQLQLAGFTSSRVSTGNMVAVRFLSPGEFTASPSAGVVAFASDSPRASEASGTVRLSVVRSGGRAGAASVEYETVEGTASAGSEFLAARGRLDWADGDASERTIEIRLLDDDRVEQTESLEVVLKNPTGAQLGGPARLSVYITDNDPSPLAAAGTTGTSAASGGGGAVAPWMLLALAGWLAIRGRAGARRWRPRAT
jgi:hypothetical protein